MDLSVFLRLANNPVPRGRIIVESRSDKDKGPVPLEFSKRYDLNSGCSVESTLLLHLAVVLAADTRPATVLRGVPQGTILPSYF